MELFVERPNELPQPVGLALEVGVAHVVAALPDFRHVAEAELARSLVSERHELAVHRAHRRRDRVPATPGLEQELVVALLAENAIDVVDRETVAFRILALAEELRRTVLALAVD